MEGMQPLLADVGLPLTNGQKTTLGIPGKTETEAAVSG